MPQPTQEVISSYNRQSWHFSLERSRQRTENVLRNQTFHGNNSMYCVVPGLLFPGEGAAPRGYTTSTLSWRGKNLVTSDRNEVLAWDLDHFAALPEAVSYFKSKNAGKVTNCRLHTLSMAYQSNRKTSARKSRAIYHVVCA